MGLGALARLTPGVFAGAQKVRVHREPRRRGDRTREGRSACAESEYSARLGWMLVCQRTRLHDCDCIALSGRLRVPVQREPQILGYTVSLLVHAGENVLRPD